MLDIKKINIVEPLTSEDHLTPNFIRDFTLIRFKICFVTFVTKLSNAEKTEDCVSIPQHIEHSLSQLILLFQCLIFQGSFHYYYLHRLHNLLTLALMQQIEICLQSYALNIQCLGTIDLFLFPF